jgi:hypothetical protein
MVWYPQSATEFWSETLRGLEDAMTAAPAKEKLQQAIDSLRSDIDRVEFWADAVEGWAAPVPEYRATDELSRHLLSSEKPEAESQPTDSSPAEPKDSRG